MSHSIDFFEHQFQRQVNESQFELNPFERLALPYISGAVLDLGCGLGNLTLEAARQGCAVTAIDASPTAIARIRRAAQKEKLAVEALKEDLARYSIGQNYDTIIAIGLLMFFPKARALGMLRDIQAHIRHAGRSIVNVLIEGTTFMDMFTPGEYYLFRREELVESFSDWSIQVAKYDDFQAPGNTVKAFSTVIARRPDEDRLNIPEHQVIARAGQDSGGTPVGSPSF